MLVQTLALALLIAACHQSRFELLQHPLLPLQMLFGLTALQQLLRIMQQSTACIIL
jgi:hypothetical protein